ncbi:MAG: hypothetical protein IJ442_02910 [Bacteroidaceae bacterium]|nr:hypothetical protein [Bacteroidaceae bacterium]
MKIIFNATLMSLLGLILMSCSTSKNAVVPPAVKSSITTKTNVEGVKVSVETVEESGFETAEALNDDGTELIKRPYKWYAGRGEADNKQVAIELAQREAYATISRILNNAVKDGAELGNVGNNGKINQSLTTHWEQISISLQKGCEPFGNISVEYNPSTRMYSATAKVAIRGDLFNKLLNSAGDFKPTDLNEEELEDFIKANKAIMEAARIR